MSRTIDVLHGVNLDQLGRRDPRHYGTQTLADLEEAVAGFGRDLGLETRFFQTNHEGAFVEHLHALRGASDGIVLNPGAWTHYAWAIHDALEITGVPAVEVHLSDVTQRDAWRQVSVVRDVCVATVSGKGVEGYRDALALLAERR
ncbi:type II 3-dehydroquinate dehydratase [Solicola sp. PLA-1-18]|uniref:type II 3-dehydroquinate dehydratase n=1 Tax=Solicola sp. PLA-1-18 TaxID=3380532 RepID=UPI003B779DA3